MKSIAKLNACLIGLVVALAGVPGQSQASLLNLTHNPLFLDQYTPPGIVVTLDDSGSMFWSYMGPSGSNGTDFTDPTLNTLYFNPNIEYTPPLRADGTQFPDSDPNNAWVDGYPNNMNDTVDLTDDYIAIRQYIYNRYDSNVRISFVDTQLRDIDDIYTTYQNYHPDWWGTRAYYSVQNDNGGYDTVYLYDDDLQNFANWYTYYNSRAKLSRAAISRAFSGFGPDFKIAWQELNRNTAFSALNKFELTHKEDFFDWLFRSPTAGGTPLRSAFERAAGLFELQSSYWSGDFNTHLSCQQNFHIAISDGGWNDGSFNEDETYNFGNNGLLQDETSLAAGIPGDTENLYSGYTGAGEQAIYSAPENGSILADIAFDSWARDLVPDLDNNVKRFKKEYTNAQGEEIVFAAGDDEWENAEFVWNPKNDPAYWQHLVTYNVGMGLDASRILDYANGVGSCPDNGIADPREAVYASLRAGDCTWPDTIPGDDLNAAAYPPRIDDVWHSSINSRGEFFSANDPAELVAALNQVVNSILEKLSRGSSSTISSGVITAGTNAFTPGFDSSTWSGNLIARPLNNNGTFGDPIWDAACILTGGPCLATGETVAQQPSRNIYTYDPLSESAQSFSVGLTGNLRSVLEFNAQSLMDEFDVTSNQIIEYVIGEREEEQAEGGVFNDRVSVLADIVHSSPYILRGPNATYDDANWGPLTDEYTAAQNDNGYLNFQIAEKDRNNTIYVGSNGGMLHAFNSEGINEGRERWAYIPYDAFDNIHRLADPREGHWSYVDNTPTVQDAFIDGQWRTVLISGMRYGGQTFFALDVTDGNSDQPNVLWEFSDQDDADMGYSYGQAEIVRLTSTGQWVALIPNGYNNSELDYPDNAGDPRNIVSGNGHAVLYVVDLETGNLIRKISTGVGRVGTPNGLATPKAVDSEFITPPGEGSPRIDIGADFAYAGDLFGNLWRFDFTDSDPSNWNAKRIVRAVGEKAQPITIQPQVVAIPGTSQSAARDVMVIYGTGKYLEPSDRSISLPADQFMVGVIDGMLSTREDLQISSSQFIEQTFSASGNFRELSSNLVDFNDDYGWKVRLSEQGERMFNPTSLLGNQVLLATSNVTAGDDPCESGGRSWLVAYDPLTGGVPSSGTIFNNITITLPNGTEVTGTGDGVLINDFVIGRPNVVEDQFGTGNIIIEGTDASIAIELQKFNWRRRNWTNLLTE